ncbi:sarcosine oxidase subunit gamma [Hasllibacter sp. MH4015]|uniref:sarcosine oxidase subunit gamma n=1 Tax=Hasllibacter sp. MH4015 TaxID=2854029 RepID=UPI001CD717FB|nr:sarcosine oxidase subunit gamma family protein [Hasllibacter sp. MH4015]
MPDLASALPGAHYAGIVTVEEAGLTGMVTLKADLDAAVGKAVRAATGRDIPEARRVVEGKMSVAWMAPDELLILCDFAEADTIVAGLSDKLGDAHHLAVNVSDARAVFRLNGAAIKDVLGKLTPADLRKLQPGEMRRTRLAQVAAAIWLSDAETAHVICFRSVAQYMFDLLLTAALPGGEVGYHEAAPG